MTQITDADREAAASYWGNDNPPLELQAAMKRHRIAAEQSTADHIAAWLDDDKVWCLLKNWSRHEFAKLVRNGDWRGTEPLTQPDQGEEND